MPRAMFALAGLLWTFIALPAASASEAVGEIARSVPAAFRTPPGASRVEARTADAVLRDETLETGAAGGLLISFADGSELTLGENSSAVVDEFVYAGPGTGSSAIRLGKGVFRFISGAMDEQNVVIETQSATLGIRGTEIFVVVFEDGSLLVVTRRGLAEIISRVNGARQSVPAGAAAALGRNGAISPIVVVPLNRERPGDNPGQEDAVFDIRDFGDGFLPDTGDEEGQDFALLESQHPDRRLNGGDLYRLAGVLGGTMSYEDAYLLWEKGYFPRADGRGGIAQSRILGALTRQTGALGSMIGRNTRAARLRNRLNELPEGVIRPDNDHVYQGPGPGTD